mgnify:CR=1 FL=1
MPSDVEIASAALHELGAAAITAFDDDSDRARVVKALYDATRDATLRAHPWNFALVRKARAQDATAPLFKYAFSYTLPTDPYCLRVIRPDWTGLPEWKVEGRAFLTDAESVSILYISRVVDPERFDALFTEAFTARLASRMAIPITGIRALMEAFYTLSIQKIAAAQSIDGQEGTPDRAESLFLTEIR